MRPAKAIYMLDRVRREAAGIVMDKDPLCHIVIPMSACAVEVPINLRNKVSLPYRVGGVALEDRLGAYSPTVAF